MANLGFIGLGTMGGPMVKRLLDAGHQVTGHNRTKSRGQWLVDLGMGWADNPRAVVETADVTLSMLRDTDALHDVALGPNGLLEGLKPGSIFIDMSTVSPEASRELADQVLAKGAHMLDAPVSGSSITLLAGNLSIMVGGDRDIFDQVKPILQAIGPTVD